MRGRALHVSTPLRERMRHGLVRTSMGTQTASSSTRSNFDVKRLTAASPSSRTSATMGSTYHMRVCVCVCVCVCARA